MRTVKVASGQTIDIKVTLATVLRVKSELGIDLTMPFAVFASTEDIPNPEGLTVVAALSGANYFVVLAVLYYAAEKSLKSQQIEAEDLADLLDGEALAAAHDALLEEWHDFSLGSNRNHTAKAIRAAIKVNQATVSKAGLAMDQAESRGLMKIDQEFQKTLQQLEAEFPSATD